MPENDLREFKPETAHDAKTETAPPTRLQPSLEEAQKAVGGLDLSLADVRKIYVGKGYEKFEKAFAKCDAKGWAAHSFSIAPIFFSFLWFFYRKMYVEGLIVLAISLAVGLGAEYFLKSGANGAAIGVAVAVAMNAKNLYWRAVDKKIAKAMQMYPDSPDSAIAWLQARGGVNYWIIALGVILFAAIIVGTLAENVPHGI